MTAPYRWWICKTCQRMMHSTDRPKCDCGGKVRIARIRDWEQFRIGPMERLGRKVKRWREGW